MARDSLSAWNRRDSDSAGRWQCDREERRYDPATGLLYIPNGKFSAVPDRPTQQDAKQASKKLLALIKDFPFKEGHAVAWLAAFLTIIGRFLVDGPVPMFMLEANTSGAGKTLLADLLAIIATGREMTRTGYYHDPIEMDKQIVATALAGDPVVLFDNIENGGSIGNSSLDRALTGRTYRGRILGKSGMTPDLDLICVFICTGNNLTLCGDVPRRIVPCRLESTMERPEERADFTIKDLKGHALEHRGELVVAALTILKAFIQAGKPDQNLTPMDFPAWTTNIRNAVKWATGKDPAIGRKDLTASDPDRQNCLALVEGWYEVQTDLKVKAMTSTELIKAVKDSPDKKFEIIRNVFSDLWPKTKAGELPSSGSIGMKVQSIRDKPFGDKRFKLAGESKRAKLWTVQTVTTPPRSGESGESGESSESCGVITRENIPLQQSDDKGDVLPSDSAGQTHQTHQTHQETSIPPRGEMITHAIGPDPSGESLTPSLRWLSGILTRTPTPKSQFLDLGNQLLLDSDPLEQAASVLKVERTIEDGVEMWSLP